MGLGTCGRRPIHVPMPHAGSARCPGPAGRAQAGGGKVSGRWCGATRAARRRQVKEYPVEWSRDLRTEGLDQLRVDVFSERFARWIVPAELGRAAAVGGMPDGGVHVLMAPLALHWCALALTVFIPDSYILALALH